MSLRERFLALLVALIWGGNFVVMRVALDYYPPLIFSTLRYVLAALPLAFFPRPPVPLLHLCLVSVPLLAGQFALLMVGIAHGMPPGLASVVMQSQVMLTILLAALFVGERATRRQAIGACAGMAGLAVIGATIGGDVPLAGFLFTLSGALSWAVGNVALRTLPKTADGLGIAAWMSAASILPCLVAALIFEGPSAVFNALRVTNLIGLSTLVYNGLLVTLVAFWIWSALMVRYPAGEVAPYALLVPVFGLIATAIVFGEQHSSLRTSGMVLVLSGVAVAVLPVRRIWPQSS